MARLPFRQGIVRHGKSPQQSFFLQQSGQYVDLIISPESTLIAFADDTKDYLYTESVTILKAWGPFTFPAQSNWLYWDINRITGIRTFGSTTLAPVSANIAPSSPSAGQLWFDTSSSNLTSMQMHEYNGAAWVRVLRVLAAKYIDDKFLSPIDGASLETNFTGTQIGGSGLISTIVGALAFDSTGNPIINQDGKFFTTEDVFTTGVPTGASLKVNNILLPAQSVGSIAAYQVVVFTEYNKINLAGTFDYIDKVYGIVEEDVATGDIGNVILEGIIFNELWDFTDGTNNPNMSGTVNDPVYITSTGELTTNISQSIPTQVVVAVIMSRQSILFSPGIYGTGGNPGNDHGSLTGLNDDDHVQYFEQTRGDARYYTKGNVDTLLSNKVGIAGDTMTGLLTLSADPVNPLGAVTKQYADASGVTTLSELTDVTAPSPSLGEVLTYSGSGWVNSPATGGSSFCIKDTDGDTFVEVGFGSSPACTDSGSNEVRIQAGTAQTTSTIGGKVTIQSGEGIAAPSGNIDIISADGISGNSSGAINLTSGNTVNANTANINITAGSVSGTAGAAGDVIIQGGYSSVNSSNTTGNVFVKGGSRSAATGYGYGLGGYNGGDVHIQTEGAYQVEMKTPGNIYLEPGAGEVGDFNQPPAGSIRIRQFGGKVGFADTPEVRFYAKNNTSFAALKAPEATTDYVMVLPAVPATSRQVLSWVNGSTATSTTGIELGFVDNPYDLLAQGYGTLVDADTILIYNSPRAFYLVGASHKGFAITPPTGSPALSAIFDVSYKINTGATATSIGTLTFAGGSNTATLSGFTDKYIASNSVLIVTCTTANGIADVAITLAGKF